jgi:NodT family efflux transporter outer membrane factor (OMF) lipoprotein
LCGALGLAACAPAPERDALHLAGELPDGWTAQAAASAGEVEPWLLRYGDEQLAALVREALANNFDLKAAAARVAAAQAQARIDGAGRLPQLEFAPQAQRARLRQDEYSALALPFNLSWELDVWGRIGAARQAAGWEAEAVAADWAGARLSLAARTAQAYFELTEAQLQTQVAEQSRKDRGTIVELVRGRFDRGLARALDLRLALTDLSNAEAQLALARNRLQSVARRLEVLLGRYPAAAQAGALRLPAPPQAMPAGLPSELLARRPDVLASFERLRAADSRLESANKALLPRVTLSAAGGTSGTAWADLADPRAAAWNLAMGLAQPIFTGGRLQADIARNEARVDEALNRYRDTALNAFREVEQALAAEEWLRGQEAALREAVEQTEASRKLAVYSYRNGFIEILTLLDSYRSTLNAQSAHLAVQRQLLNNRIDLYLALGGEI